MIYFTLLTGSCCARSPSQENLVVVEKHDGSRLEHNRLSCLLICLLVVVGYVLA